MPETVPSHLPIAELAPLIRDRRVAPTAVVDAILERIAALDATLGAYVTVTADLARAAAAAAEREIASGCWRGPLHGIPVSLKDNIDLAGVPTTACSAAFADYVPVADAAVVRRLKASGAVIVGKTRLWELAMRPEDSPPSVVTRNPWDTTRSPMGSSGGAAAAVAAGLCHAAIGTDTGGSIRGPASACGVVGFKPTHGLVPRDGVLPVSWTLDHVGPLARRVADAALVTAVIADDPRMRLPDEAGDGVEGLRFAVPDDLLEGIDHEVVVLLDDVLRRLEAAGGVRRSVRLARVRDAERAQSLITMAEAASMHAASLGERAARLGPSARRRIEEGSRVTADRYQAALRTRVRFRREFEQVMAGLDVILTPTSPSPPPLLADAYPAPEGGRPANLFRWPFNLLGAPALSLPCGLATGGLPVGLQVAAPAGQDRLVLRVALACERLAPWGDRRPPL